MRVCPRCTELYPEDGAYCPVDGAELMKANDPLIGKTVAQRYRVLSRLGGGGMSTVYLARHVMIERLSAMKVLRGDLASSEAQRTRFLGEARAVNRINHGNIVEITDYGEWDGLLYLVMEYVAGEPLAQALAQGPLTWQRAASIGAQLASALARAHQMGVIHRDLKPGNVLLVRRPVGEVAMLTDFGIAKIIGSPSLTLTSQLFGTPGYIAPEYIEGGGASTRADLYSLGVVLYETLTAKLPYEDKGTSPLMLRVLREPPTPLAAHRTRAPAALEALVMRLLSRKPEHRGRDAFQVFDELATLLLRDGISSAGPLILIEAGPSTVPGKETADDDGETSRPFAHLVPLCESGLGRVESAATRAGTISAGPMSLLDVARTSTRTLVGAAHSVSVEQARIADLERYGRTLRSSLGHAIDEIGRDLSRVNARLEDLTRRRGLSDSLLPGGSGSTLPRFALEDEEVRLLALADELAGEVTALRDHLKTKSDSVEEKLSVARASLESRVSALRRDGSDAWFAIDAAGRAFGIQALPPDTMPKG